MYISVPRRTRNRAPRGIFYAFSVEGPAAANPPYTARFTPLNG